MFIEYPPMLTGNNEVDVGRMRNYLYGVVDMLNRSEEDLAQEKDLPAAREDVRGFRKIYSSDSSGITQDGKIPCGNDDYRAHMYVAVIDAPGEINTGFVPVIMLRRGGDICGSALWNTSAGLVNFNVRIKTNGSVYTVKQATYINLSNENDSGTLPGGEGSAADGYTIRELYAVVL